MKSKIKSLEELNNKFDYIIWDSSALTREKFNGTNELDYIPRLINQLEQGEGRIDLTQRTIRDYLTSSYKGNFDSDLYNKRIELLETITANRREFITLRGKSANYKNIQPRDISEIKTSRKDEMFLYLALMEGIKKKYKDIDVFSEDFDIFATGMIFNKQRGKTAVVSNSNLDVIKLWNKFGNVPKKEKFVLYNRLNSLGFIRPEDLKQDNF